MKTEHTDPFDFGQKVYFTTGVNKFSGRTEWKCFIRDNNLIKGIGKTPKDAYMDFLNAFESSEGKGPNVLYQELLEDLHKYLLSPEFKEDQEYAIIYRLNLLTVNNTGAMKKYLESTRFCKVKESDLYDIVKYIQKQNQSPAS